MFDMYIALNHAPGVEHIGDAENGLTGFMVQYMDRTNKIKLPGLCWAVKKRFCTNPGDLGSKTKNKGPSTKVLGSLIHRHVFHQLECMRNGSCTCVPRTPNVANAQASKLIQVIKDKGWIPVRSELAIMSSTIELATRVDLICFDPDVRRFVLVSWKTGYKNIVTQMSQGTDMDGCDPMRAPLDFVPDNDRSRNQLQLLCEYLILIKEYGMDLVQALIVYIRFDEDDENRVVIDTAASWWWNKPELCDSVWEALKERKRHGSRS